MDHGGHGMPSMSDVGHGGGHNMPSHDHGGGMDPAACTMSMVWNTATQGMCVVFPSWHVTGQHSFVLTLAALFIIALMLERIRYQIRALDGKLIVQHRIDSGLLNAGWGGARDHRRKASVQQVLVGNGSTRSPLKADGSLGGPALVSAMSIGDRRGASPSHLHNETASFGSRSEDDAPLLPSAYSRSRKPPPVSLLQRLTQGFVPHLPISRANQLHRAALYLVAVSISMFIMLVFMTYNAWLIAAVLLGAGTGHYLFSRDLGWSIVNSDKTACH